MKRLMVVFCLVLFTSNLAWGVRGPSKVSAGKHNLSVTGASPFKYNTKIENICVFCHTPHGGTLDGPLWNRDPAINGFEGGAGWQHYNSASLSTSLQGLSTSRPPNPESMICLSCHDGSLSINHVINLPNDLGPTNVGPLIQTESTGSTDTKIIPFFGNPGARIGGRRGFGTDSNTGDFTDDHPFSFSYTAVLGSFEYGSGQPKYNSLKSAVTAEGLGVQFFTGALNVECSSCHDPHVNHDDSKGGDSSYSPFLIMPNTGSALCLACHTK